MNKVIRNGKVAVLVSGGWGAGWFSWHGIEELLFDPVIVEMLESEKEPEDIGQDVLKYCHEKYGEDVYFGGIDGLYIEWVPEGSKFVVFEYDGSETLWLDNKVKWITA